MENEKIKVDPTEKIIINDNESIEEQYAHMSKEELYHLLNYVETDHERIKLIKKILKTKK